MGAVHACFAWTDVDTLRWDALTAASQLPQVKVVAPGKTAKRGNGGSLASRQALLHSLCHIENWAVDLSWGKRDFRSRGGFQRARQQASLPR